MDPKVGLWRGDGLSLGWKAHRIRRPNVPGRRDPSLEYGNAPTPLDHTRASSLFLGLPLLPGRALFFVRALLLYILLFWSSSSYTCQSSIPILECTSHRPFFLALCELLWPPSHCPGVTSTLMVSGVSCKYLIQRWQLLLGLLLHHAPMASL